MLACSSQEPAAEDAPPSPLAPSNEASAGPGSQPAAADVGFCGGVGGFECAQGEYCEYRVGTCGKGDQPGECRPRPELCTMEFEPVCGCDGATYSNACAAAAAGVSVQREAPCDGDAVPSEP